MFWDINAISVLEVTWKTGIKKARKASQLVNVKTYLQLLKAFRIEYTGCFFDTLRLIIKNLVEGY